MEGEAFRMFLIEYKKRLPDTPENKDFIEMMDYMIWYFEGYEIIYQDRWNDWISPNDPKYWRNPTPEETRAIEARRKNNTLKKKGFWDYIFRREV
jgi:hypothetical protein